MTIADVSRFAQYASLPIDNMTPRELQPVVYELCFIYVLMLSCNS